jgi:hypothetical protein
MICNLDNIQHVIKKEGLELMVVSYGGSCTNILVKLLEKNCYKCCTNIWHKLLCHSPVYVETDIPIIYIYDNPIKAFMSMKNRNNGYWDVNQQKMTNNYNVKLSDETLLKCMINQFHNWTSIRRKNVLIIHTSELFKKTIVKKLERFLKKPLNHFPVKYVKPKTNINDISDTNLINLFIKYKDDIIKINSFIPPPNI